MEDSRLSGIRVKDTSKWFHPHISGKESERLLKEHGYVGSFLVRESRSHIGNYTLSVRREKEVIHIKIHNSGDYYDVATGSEFASLQELVSYYTEEGNPLRELNGNLVEAKYPLLNKEAPTADKWFHGNLETKSAENLLKQIGKNNCFLVRERTKVPGEFVLCVLVNKDTVKNIIVLCQNGKYFVKADVVANHFKTLSDLVEHYHSKPICEGTGYTIFLGEPVVVGVASYQTKPPTESKESEEISPDRHLVEFEQLQKQECQNKAPRIEGQKTENKDRNRYKNILPFDHSRVVLSDGGQSDYINANYIKVPSNRMTYIATQGCLASTVPDFWRMVWQENSQVIAMITKLVEVGKNKCTRYWPELPDKPMIFDVNLERIKVHFLDAKMSPTKDFEFRKFKVEKATEDPHQPGEYKVIETRMICHYNYTAWPDKFVPKQPDSLLSLLDTISRHQRSLSKVGPIVVHCSAGIGRTGTFIVLGFIIDELQRNGIEHEVNIKELVSEIRKQRSGMVQTELQYKFIFDAIKIYKEKNLAAAEESEYANLENLN